MQYRKRPILVEATQFHSAAERLPGVHTDEKGEAYVITIHGQIAYLAPGDWIIREPDGEHHYPCKAEIFEATYEAVGGSA